MKYFLAIDQGTSTTRAILFDQVGNQVCNKQYEITQYYPHDGWVEHCPEEIWKKTLLAIKSVINLYGDKIQACGITNQRETVVAWDKATGKCIYNAIVWQDRRSDTDCQNYIRHLPQIKSKTGLLLDAYFSATKIKWILDNCSEAQRLLKKDQLAVGTIDSYLVWRLTNDKIHVTDVTNASRTLLFNINSLTWDDELLELFNIPGNILPSVKSCIDYFGVIDKKWCDYSIPITAIAGDQQAATVGQGCFQPGMVKSTYGTGCFLMLNTGKSPVFSSHDLLTTIAYSTKDELVYGLEGSIFNAGTAVKWLRDELCLIKQADETEHLASKLNDNDGVYMVPAFTGLGAPHWDATARGAILGIQRDTNFAHIARAALESVCYQTRDILDCMAFDSPFPITKLRVDGGMVVNNWLLQFLADSCRIVVERPQEIETTALGIALLASVGVEHHSSLSQAESFWQLDKQFNCKMAQTQSEALHRKWLQAVDKVKT